MRATPLVGAAFLTVFVATLPTWAAQRSFTAVLERVPACSFAGAAGTATLVIDDATGEVTGSLVIGGFEKGATITSAGIRNKAAGDNLVGGFAGHDANAPNGTHAVTTTLNAIALPKILGGDGSVAVFAGPESTGCQGGAIRGDLVEGTSGSMADAGSDASVPSPGTPPPAGGGTSSGPGSPVATDAGASPAATNDDGGCSNAPGGASSKGSAIAALLTTGVVVLRRRRARRELRD